LENRVGQKPATNAAHLLRPAPAKEPSPLEAGVDTTAHTPTTTPNNPPHCFTRTLRPPSPTPLIAPFALTSPPRTKTPTHVLSRAPPLSARNLTSETPTHATPPPRFRRPPLPTPRPSTRATTREQSSTLRATPRPTPTLPVRHRPRSNPTRRATPPRPATRGNRKHVAWFRPRHAPTHARTAADNFLIRPGVRGANW